MIKNLPKILLLLTFSFLLTGCTGKEKIPDSLHEENTEETKSVTAVLEKPENTERDLNATELRQFTGFVNDVENYGFLLSEYSKPEEVKLEEVLYNGAGMDMMPLTEEERDAYEKAAGSLNTDFTKLSSQQILEFLQKKLNWAPDQIQLDWFYLEKSDSYLFPHGDTNYMTFTCTSGKQIGEQEYILYCKANDDSANDCILTLNKSEHTYQFAANRFEENTHDPQSIWEISEQSFDVNLESFGAVQFVTYAPNTYHSPLGDVVFHLKKNGQTIYTLKEVRPGNERTNETFVEVNAVSFQDYDKDGYQDIIILCTYEWVSGEKSGEHFKEARIYKGAVESLQYMDNLSFQINEEGNNESISRILEEISLEPLDLTNLPANVIRQIELFAKARREWILSDYISFSCGYAVYDLNGDGNLELLTQATAGTGMYSENHFYTINAAGDGIVELPQDYYAENAEFDICGNSPDLLVFKDPSDGTRYYMASDIAKNGYMERLLTDGIFYLKDGRIHSLPLRSNYSLLKVEDSIEETFYDSNHVEIDKTAWAQIYDNFSSGMEAQPYQIGWQFEYTEDLAAAPETWVLRMLVKSYEEGISNFSSIR